MKTYNFTYIRSTEAEDFKEAAELFEEMLSELTAADIFESGQVEEDDLPD